MHSSQFGITFTDSRAHVNSNGPIHCIRSLNRMVRYSVMPLPVGSASVFADDAWFTLGQFIGRGEFYTLNRVDKVLSSSFPNVTHAVMPQIHDLKNLGEQ